MITMTVMRMMVTLMTLINDKDDEKMVMINSDDVVMAVLLTMMI